MVFNRTRAMDSTGNRKVLDYAARKRTLPGIVARWIGLLCFVTMLITGIVTMWYGGDGLYYALVDAPARDRSGDIFGAGLVFIIGAVLTMFGGRWAHAMWGSTRRDGYRSLDISFYDDHVFRAALFGWPSNTFMILMRIRKNKSMS